MKVFENVSFVRVVVLVMFVCVLRLVGLVCTRGSALNVSWVVCM